MCDVALSDVGGGFFLVEPLVACWTARVSEGISRRACLIWRSFAVGLIYPGF